MRLAGAAVAEQRGRIANVIPDVDTRPGGGNAICGKEGAGGASEDKRSRGAGAPDSPDRKVESEKGSGGRVEEGRVREGIGAGSRKVESEKGSGQGRGRSSQRRDLTRVPKSAEALVATTVRTIFQQPSAEAVHAQHARVVEQLEARFPAAAAMLAEAAAEVLAFTACPVAHWKQVWSNNPQERLNREIRRRTDVVGIFPNRAAVVAPGRRGARRAARRVGGGEALHDDGDPAAPARARGHFRRGGAAASCQLAIDKDGAL